MSLYVSCYLKILALSNHSNQSETLNQVELCKYEKMLTLNQGLLLLKNEEIKNSFVIRLIRKIKRSSQNYGKSSWFNFLV